MGRYSNMTEVTNDYNKTMESPVYNVFVNSK